MNVYRFYIWKSNLFKQAETVSIKKERLCLKGLPEHFHTLYNTTILKCPLFSIAHVYHMSSI